MSKVIQRPILWVGICVSAILVLVIGGLTYYTIRCVNRFVVLDENVIAAWSQVENQYQRRADLIPNLVSTVKGYAAHEQDTLEAVIKARQQTAQYNLSAQDLTNPQAMQQFEQAQQSLTGALSRMLLVVERYPELKANQNFLALQSQLEGTENRITVARKDYIDAVFSLNSGLRQFPAGWLARTFGHIQTKASFSANPQADQVPEVTF